MTGGSGVLSFSLMSGASFGFNPDDTTDQQVIQASVGQSPMARPHNAAQACFGAVGLNAPQPCAMVKRSIYIYIHIYIYTYYYI